MKDIIKEFKISKATTYSGRRYNLFLFDYGYLYTISDEDKNISFRLPIHTVKPLMLCESLCEKNFPKSAKIGKNQKRCGKTYLTNSIVYNILRGLGNSEVLSTNP